MRTSIRFRRSKKNQRTVDPTQRKSSRSGQKVLWSSRTDQNDQIRCRPKEKNRRNESHSQIEFIQTKIIEKISQLRSQLTTQRCWISHQWRWRSPSWRIQPKRYQPRLKNITSDHQQNERTNTAYSVSQRNGR